MEDKELLIQYLKSKPFNTAEIWFKNNHRNKVKIKVTFDGLNVFIFGNLKIEESENLTLSDYRVLNFDKDSNRNDKINMLLDEYCVGTMSNEDFIEDLNNIPLEDSILMTKKDAEIFFKAILDDDLKPNKALIEAAKRYKDKL